MSSLTPELIANFSLSHYADPGSIRRGRAYYKDGRAWNVELVNAGKAVIHLDPWWNPAVEMQASDRAHRIGQENPVFVYKIIARDTVEEKILQLQEKKRALVRSLITTEASFFKSLTQDDVKNLFS